MKQLTEITGLMLILVIALKLIDFSALGVLDVIILALLCVYAVSCAASFLRRKK